MKAHIAITSFIAHARMNELKKNGAIYNAEYNVT